MPDDFHESSFMVAAQRQVDQLTRANRVNRRVMRVLAVVAAVVVVACAVLTSVAVDQHGTDMQLRQQAVQLRASNARLRAESITSCEGGNSFRQGQTQVWGKFIGIIVTSKAPASTVRAADSFLAYVEKVDVLHDCQKLYASGSPGG